MPLESQQGKTGRLELQALEQGTTHVQADYRSRVFGKTSPFQCATKEAKLQASGQRCCIAKIVISSPADWWHCAHLPLGVLLTNNTLLRA